MKFIRYRTGAQTGWAILEGSLVRPLSQAPWLGVAPEAKVLPLRDLHFLAPVCPSKIVCIGHNFAEHAAELGHEPAEPVIFLKPPSALIGPGAEIPYPPTVTRLDYEAELAVVIGQTAADVEAEQAKDVIFGYTCANDITARDLQRQDGQWTRAKGFDGFAPIGPWIETELDASDLRIQSLLNGEVRQSARTSQFVWSIERLIAFVSSVMTLLPGDVILTGTPPGVGPMRAEDTISVDIEGIGTLTNTVVTESF